MILFDMEINLNMKFNMCIIILLCTAIQFKTVDNRSLIDTNLNPLAMCSRLPSFLRKHTNLRCSSFDKTMMSILYNGSKIATKECQHQFRMMHWNCSSAPESLPRIVSHAFPETAYLFAIHSAGIAYSLANACSRGLVKGCQCNKKEKILRDEATNVIVADKECTVRSIKYGTEQSRRLLKNEKESDARWLVDEHNKEAGRLALMAHQLKKNTICRCRGVSGACAVKKCIQRLPKFRDVSSFLKEKYKAAIRVGTDNYGKKLIPSKRTIKEPTEQDLLFTEESPKFCDKNLEFGSLGTKSRTCIKDHQGPESCNVLCCNRGYETIVKTVEKRCYCRFTYCCNVTCQTCSTNVTTHVCK